MIISSLALATAAYAPMNTVAVQANPPIQVSRIKTYTHLEVVSAAAPKTGSRFALTLQDTSVRVIDARTLNSVYTFNNHPQPAEGVAFSNDGRWLVTGDETARIFLWDLNNGTLRREFSRDRGHSRGIQALAISHDNQMIASVGKDDTIRVWSVNGAHPIKTIAGNGANFYGVEFMPSGALVTGTLKEGIRIYTPRTFELASALTLAGGQGANGLALNAAGTQAVSAGRDGNVVIWDIPKRARFNTLKGHTDWVMGVAYSPNGRLVATSSNDMNVIVWDMRTLQAIKLIDEQSFVGAPVTFTGDGRHLITANSSGAPQVHVINPPQPAPAPARRR